MKLDHLSAKRRTFVDQLRRFIDPYRVATKRLRVLRAALEAFADTDDWEELDDADRTVAAWMAARRARRAHEAGYAAHDWGRRKAPGGDPFAPGSKGTGRRFRSWYDHPYRLRNPGGEAPEVYVAEPYYLTTGHLRELLELANEGWEVVIDADALHFPVRTVRVELRRREDANRVSIPHHYAGAARNELVDEAREAAKG